MNIYLNDPQTKIVSIKIPSPHLILYTFILLLTHSLYDGEYLSSEAQYGRSHVQTNGPRNILAGSRGEISHSQMHKFMYVCIPYTMGYICIVLNKTPTKYIQLYNRIVSPIYRGLQSTPNHSTIQVLYAGFGVRCEIQSDPHESA